MLNGVLGIGGKKDKNRPYPGYKLSYGSMTLANIISAGYVPLSVKYTVNAFDVNTTAGGHQQMTITSSSGGSKTLSLWRATAISDSSKSAIYKGSCSAYVDLMNLYSTDLEACKNITGISVGSAVSIAIVQWLEPETSGGGVLKTAYLSVLRAFSNAKGRVRTMLCNVVKSAITPFDMIGGVA